MCMTSAFCCVIRLTKMRCVAKKFSTPCCTHPDSKETKDDSRERAVLNSDLTVLGIMTSVFAALQHQVKPSIPCADCQSKSTIILQCNKEAAREPCQGGHQEVRKPQTLRHFWEPLHQLGRYRRPSPKRERLASCRCQDRGGPDPRDLDPDHHSPVVSLVNCGADGAACPRGANVP